MSKDGKSPLRALEMKTFPGGAWPGPRGGWTATRKASWEICMRFADWLHSRVDLSEVNISRIWKFSKDETIGL